MFKKLGKKPNKRKKMTRVGKPIIAAALLLTSLICYKIYCNAHYNELYKELGDMQKQYEDLQNEQIQLDVRLNAMADLENIEQIAVQRLGMSKIQQYQINYVNLGSEDRCEIVAVDDGFGEVFRSFSMIWEYLN